MNHEYCDFLHNTQHAANLYQVCENLVRKSEKIGSFRTTQDYGNPDWIPVAAAFSIILPYRRQQLEYDLTVAYRSGLDPQQAGYNHFMLRCYRENIAVYCLEGFRQHYVNRNTSWKLSFDEWIEKIKIKEYGKSSFKYFGHTKNPLYVK